MRLYRVDFHEGSEGALVSWHANKVDAHRKLREWRAEFGESQGTEGVTAVQVPTNRAELIKWLNVYFNRDNG